MGKFRSNHASDSWRPGGGGESARDRGRGRSTSRERHRSPPPFSSRKRKAGIPSADTWTPGSPGRDFDKSSYQTSYPHERKRSRDMSIDSRNARRYSSISPKRLHRDDRNLSPMDDFDDSRSRPSGQRRRHPPRSPKRRRSPSPQYPGHKSSKKSRRGRSPRPPRRISPEPPSQTRRRDDSRGRSPRRISQGPSVRNSNWDSQQERPPLQKSRSPSPARKSPARHRSNSPTSSPNNRNYRSSRFPSPPRHNDRDIRRSSPPSDRRLSPPRRRRFSPPLPSRSRRDRRNKKRKGSPKRRSPPSSRPQSRSSVRRQPSPRPGITGSTSPVQRPTRSPRSQSREPSHTENNRASRRASIEAPSSKEVDMLREAEDDSKFGLKSSNKTAVPRKNYQDEKVSRPRSPIPSGPRAHNTEPRINRGNYKGRNFDPDYALSRRKRSPRGKRSRSDFHHDDDRYGGQSYRPPFTGANAIPTGPSADVGHNAKQHSGNQYARPPQTRRDCSPSFRTDRYNDDHRRSREGSNEAASGQDSGEKSRRSSYDNDSMPAPLEQVAISTPVEVEAGNSTNVNRRFSDGADTDNMHDKNETTSMPPPSLADAPSSKTSLEAPSKPVGGDEPKGKIRFSLSKSGKPSVVPPARFETPGRGRGFATSSNSTPVGPRKSQNMEPPATTEQPHRIPSTTDVRSVLNHAGNAVVVQRNPVKMLQRTTSIYDRISMVGEGTYGKVYKAQNAASRELVALKRIRLEQERDGFPVTALRELKILQSLQHKNVICLLETMVEKNEFYMVFEYMDHDLTGILNHPTFKLDLSNIKDLAKQFIEGLEYLHHRSVLHRDIKGSNILLDNNGQLKLADFGLARTYQKRRKDLDYTNRIITLWYRPPEILLGATVYGAAVDMWSAGCVLVELFTSKAIFPGRTEIDQLDCIYNVLGTPDQQIWPDLKAMPWYELIKPKELKTSVFEEKYKNVLPPDALNLVQQLFQFDPKKRPTATEVLEHSYFRNDPAPQPCLAIRDVKGDWHEYESKGRRKKEQKQQQEQQKLAQEQKRQQ